MLSIEENKSYLKQELYHICKKNVTGIDNSSEIMFVYKIL